MSTMEQYLEKLDWYINEQPSVDYPEHTNQAILINQVMAKNPQFHLDHENGNHTIWMSEHHRIVVSRCEEPTLKIYRIERIL